MIWTETVELTTLCLIYDKGQGEGRYLVFLFRTNQLRGNLSLQKRERWSGSAGMRFPVFPLSTTWRSCCRGWNGMICNSTGKLP